MIPAVSYRCYQCGYWVRKVVMLFGGVMVVDADPHHGSPEVGDVMLTDEGLGVDAQSTIHPPVALVLHKRHECHRRKDDHAPR